MNLTVSVVVPTYNRSHSVSEAIDSILAQNPPADEVIVVDDGSTDATADVLAKYGDLITVYRQPNSGAAAARNTGIRHSTSDWITFLDSDDVWLPGRIACLHKDLEGSPDNIVGHTGNMYLTGQKLHQNLFELRGWRFPNPRAALVFDVLPMALSGIFPLVTALRRDQILSEGGFRENMRVHEDTALFSILALKGPWIFTSDVLGEARRLADDDKALSSIERKHPLEAAKARVEFTSALLKQDLSPSQRTLVMDHASKALLMQAAAEHTKGVKSHRRTAIASARLHSSMIKGWLKLLPPLLFGQTGYKFSLKMHKSFTRS